MALNNLGLGFIFTAKDLASGVMGKVRGNLLEVEGAGSAAAKTFGNAFKAFGTGLAIMGAGLAGFALLEPAIAASGEISKAIKLVATEADLSIFPMEKMREVADKLALSFGSLPVDQAKAMYKAVALGANDATKATNFLTGANLLAVAGNADLELSANALGGALNAYHADFSQATAYSDALFTAMKMGNTTVQDLAASIGRVTSSAANLGVSIDEVLGAVSVMTNKGVAAAEAVSGLKEALANVVHPSADAKAEAARLGIKFTQTALRGKGLQKFLQEITSSSKFTADSFSKLFTSVEGSNAIIQIASGQMGDYNSVMTAMGQKAGATKAGFDLMSQGLGFQKKKLEANKEILLATIGDAITPFVTTLVRGLNLIMESFNKIPKPIVAVITKIFLAVSAAMVLVGGLIAAKAGIAMLIVGLKAAGITFLSLLGTMLPVIAAIALITLAFYGFKIAYEQNIGGFADFVDRQVARVKLVFEGLAQLFTQGGFSGAVRDELNQAKNQGLKSFLIDVYVFAKRIEHAFEGIRQGFAAWVETVDGPIQDLIAAFEKLETTLGFLGDGGTVDQAKSKWAAFGSAGVKIGHVLGQAFEIVIAIVQAVVEIFDGMASTFKYTGDIVGFVGTSFSGLGTKISELFVQLGIMKEGTEGASGAWKGLGVILGWIVNLVVGLIGVFVTLVSVAVSIVSGVIGAFQSLWSGLVDILYGIILFIGGVFTGNWSDAWTGLKLIVFGIIDGIIGILAEFVGVVAGVVDSIAGMFGKKLTLQADVKDWKKDVHNDNAKDWGILNTTGQRGPDAANVGTTANVAPPTKGLESHVDKPMFGPISGGNQAVQIEALTAMNGKQLGVLESIARNTAAMAAKEPPAGTPAGGGSPLVPQPIPG